jgi:hypothetical protein
MTDLDQDLAKRLGRLAEAVPLSVGRLDPVHRTAVQSRQRVRMAWLTPVAFLAAIGLLLVAGQVSWEIGVPGPTDGPIALLTAESPSQICPLARGGGVLSRDQVSGLGVKDSTGAHHSVRWPFGYTARITDGRAELLAGETVVAREGQRVTFGGAGHGDAFFACGDVHLDLESGPPEPVRSAQRQGDLQLTLEASRSHYIANQPIDVFATLAYDGPQASVTFGHDDTGPIGFAIREKVYGAIRVTPVSELMCARTTLARGQPLVSDFRKSASFSGDDPNAAAYEAWFHDPVFRLPAGTWHLVARAKGEPACGVEDAPSFDLQAEITIVVDPDPDAPPDPTAVPSALLPVFGGDDIGTMTLQVKAAHATYELNSPVDIDTWYAFADGPPEAAALFDQEVAFSIVQLDPAATVVRDRGPDPDCSAMTLRPNEERHVAIDDKDVVHIEAVDWPWWSPNALERGVLDLPVGRWRITADVRAKFGPCGSPSETWQTRASVVVEVIPYR